VKVVNARLEVVRVAIAPSEPVIEFRSLSVHARAMHIADVPMRLYRGTLPEPGRFIDVRYGWFSPNRTVFMSQPEEWSDRLRYR
jgi:hypothetical protein